MRKLSAWLLHLISLVIQVAAFTFVFVPLMFYVGSLAGFLSFMQSEYVTYGAAAVCMFILMLFSFGVFGGIKKGRMIFAIIFGGGIFAAVSYLSLTTTLLSYGGATLFAAVPAEFYVIAYPVQYIPQLANPLYLFLAVGGALLIAFLLSGAARMLRRPRKRVAGNRKSISSASVAPDTRYQPERPETFVRNIHGELISESEYYARQNTARNYKG